MEEVSFDRNSVTSREWGPTHHHLPDIPKIDVLMLPGRINAVGVGESAQSKRRGDCQRHLRCDRVRFRELPFTPERILAGCG